jgi:hypothetical protein
MKLKSFRIRLHSSIDLITNSSSETFIVQGQKSLESVRQVLSSLGVIEGTHIDTPYLCLVDIPDTLEYRKLINRYERYEDRCNEHPELSNLHRPKYRDGMTKSEREAYDKAYDAYLAKYRVLEAKLYKDQWETGKREWTEYLHNTFRLNKIQEADFPAFSFHCSRNRVSPNFEYDYSNIDKLATDKIFQMSIFLQRSICYSGDGDIYTYAVGDIIIDSTTDNSIPWDSTDDILTTFNCQRIHLG